MKLTSTIISVFFLLLPSSVTANCVPMTDVPASFRTNPLTKCDSSSECICRMFSTFLDCDENDNFGSFPRVCPLEELTREADCMPLATFEEMDITDNCEDACPGKCRVFAPVFAVCDVGDDFAGSRDYPLLCEPIDIDIGREDPADEPCVSIADYPEAITHKNSVCWNSNDYCSQGKCRAFGTELGGYYFDCDEGNHFGGVFDALCDTFVP